ncbi:MAG: PAS domain S-box protein [Chloroflexi bacterium]|nr:MAG: PAS domain S-box protein [Chloroflexota bacterium]
MLEPANTLPTKNGAPEKACCKNGTTDLAQVNAALKREIAERKLIEEALRQSEERFRQFITSISDHIYVTRITAAGERANLYISPNVEKLTGYPRQNFVDDWSYWASNVIHPDDRPIAAHQAATLARGENSETEYRVIRANGQEIWVRDSARVETYQPTSQNLMVYGVVSDITGRKLAEIENTALHTQTKRRARALEILNKAGQTITSTLDLNTVLEQVLHQVQMLFEAEGASILLYNPVRNKLVFEAVSAEDADLFLGKALYPTEGIAGWVLQNKKPAISANARQDYRFLQESLTNVAKHSQATQVQVTLGISDSTVNLSVKDNGEGFSQSVDQAFSNQLSGIGLLGMRERLELLGGWLDVDSRPGEGTCITAHLPLEAC